MKQETIVLARKLDEAARKAKAIDQLSKLHDFSLNDAYGIQKESVEIRVRRGERLTGYKLGFTSKAKMEQMGVHELIWGRLTDAMAILDAGVMELDRFIHPRVEPEVAFLIKKDVTDIVPLEMAFDYIEGVAPALEIIDSRYSNFKFSLEDVVADNCSSAGYVIGPWQNCTANIENLGLSLTINGQVMASGTTTAILGNPLQSLVEATKLAKTYSFELKEGMVLLAGAATAAHYVHRGDKVQATFQQLGSVVFEIN